MQMIGIYVLNRCLTFTRYPNKLGISGILICRHEAHSPTPADQPQPRLDAAVGAQVQAPDAGATRQPGWREPEPHLTSRAASRRPECPAATGLVLGAGSGVGHRPQGLLHPELDAVGQADGLVTWDDARTAAACRFGLTAFGSALGPFRA